MVVFTCQKCNSTLKKNSVQKHNSCRPFFLTCIDCLKDFRGLEYDEHKSCITEAQKYGGSKAVIKPQGVKQEKWMEIAHKALEKIAHIDKFKQICLFLFETSNIPRHRKKFHNYVKSISPKLYESHLVNEIFSHLEKERSNTNEDVNETNNSKNLSVLKEISKENESTLEQDKSFVKGKDIKKKKRKKEQNNEGDNTKNENDVHAEDEAENISHTEILESAEIINELPTDEVISHLNKKKKKKKTLLETEMQISDDVEGDNLKKFKLNGNKMTKKEHPLGKNEYLQNKEDEENCDNIIEEKQNESIRDQNYKQPERNIEINGGNGIDLLSKKERKKLKKQKKYLNEIAEIENVQNEKESDELKSEEKVKKKKKKNIKNEIEASSSVNPKRKLEADNIAEDIRGKKIKLNETLPEEEILSHPEKKFKWGNVIKQVLENNPDNEMSLKKLRKKVLNEYTAQRGDDVPYEKLLGTFNKKINSTIGVKILKDKAQLSV